MKCKLVIIINPDSGSSSTDETDIRQCFADQDVSLTFYDIKKGTPALVESMRAKQPDVIVAAGGDGTVNTAAVIATQLNLPLGVLPVGTLNHFAKDLGLALDLPTAAKTIMEGKLRRIDYADINGRVFVNNCNLGGYPETILKRDASAITNKWLAAAVAAIKTFRQHRKQLFDIVIDGHKQQIQAGSLFIGNNCYQLAGTKFTTRQRLDEGILQFVIIKTGRIRHLLAIGISFLLRKSHEKVTTYKAQTIEIRSKHSSYNVAVDGEVVQFSMPLKITIHPKALQVIY